jgi:hypothetical protein
LALGSFPIYKAFFSQNSMLGRKIFHKMLISHSLFYSTTCNHHTPFVKAWGLAEDKDAMTWNENKQLKSWMPN